jgi:hypothetical protein
VEVVASRPQSFSDGERVVKDRSLLNHEFARPVGQLLKPLVGGGVTLGELLAILRPKVLTDGDDVVRGDDGHGSLVLATEA